MNKKRRGRPEKDGALRSQYRLRMSDDMVERLDNLTRITGKSRADIFREAFNIYENLEKTKREDADLDIEEVYDEDFEDDDETNFE